MIDRLKSMDDTGVRVMGHNDLSKVVDLRGVRGFLLIFINFPTAQIFEEETYNLVCLRVFLPDQTDKNI